MEPALKSVHKSTSEAVYYKSSAYKQSHMQQVIAGSHLDVVTNLHTEAKVRPHRRRVLLLLTLTVLKKRQTDKQS